jgi:GxxExxY protein
LDTEEIFEVKEPGEAYYLNNLIYKEESYEIISCCYEIHKMLGRKFLEIVYNDALEHEFNLRGIPFIRAKKFEVSYKDKILRHSFNSDFIVYDKIVLETKAQEDILEKNYKQTINYLSASQMKLGILVNFGEEILKFKKVVL